MGNRIFFKKSRIVKVVFCDRTKHHVWERVTRTDLNGRDFSGFYYEGKPNSIINDGKPVSREELEDKGLTVDDNNVVYNPPVVTVFLEHGEMVKRTFYDPEEASNWAEELMTDSGWKETVSYDE